MIKLTIKLLIVAAVLNAAVRAGSVAWHFFQFKDAAQQAAIFGARTPTVTLHAQMLRKAKAFSIPIAPQAVVVTREGASTTIEVSYVDKVELLPRWVRDVPLEFSVEGLEVANAAAAP